MHNVFIEKHGIVFFFFKCNNKDKVLLYAKKFLDFLLACVAENAKKMTYKFQKKGYFSSHFMKIENFKFTA